MIARIARSISAGGVGRWLLLAALLATLAAPLAACGTKSRPELPEGQNDQYPRQYPDPNEL